MTSTISARPLRFGFLTTTWIWQWSLQKMAKSKGESGLYAAIHAKRERIKAGSDEKMRKPGARGAPTAAAFKAAAKTAKKK
jgi:hypothetical protein